MRCAAATLAHSARPTSAVRVAMGALLTGSPEMVKVVRTIDRVASAEGRDALARLPEKRFENPTEVSEAVGKRS